jgi:hypothetical protein
MLKENMKWNGELLQYKKEDSGKGEGINVSN